jgi:hypothetical protein
MPTDDERGMEVFAFHRTMSLGNWPFLVLLLVIATAASTSFILDRNGLGVAAMFGILFGFPLVIGAIEHLPELLGGRVLLGVTARGIVWGRLWQRGFIPWSNLAVSAPMFVREPSLPFHALVEHRGADKPIAFIYQKDIGAAVGFIAERLPAR